jgi:hypothetical protein
MVENLPHHFKVNGLSPVTIADTVKENCIKSPCQLENLQSVILNRLISMSIITCSMDFANQIDSLVGQFYKSFRINKLFYKIIYYIISQADFYSRKCTSGVVLTTLHFLCNSQMSPIS